MDFIYNGQASGNVAAALAASNFDVNVLRPYLGKDGYSYITVNSGETDPKTGKPIMKSVRLQQNTASLRNYDWKLIDDAVIRAAKPRLRVFGDLRRRGLQLTIPNGMGKTMLEQETMGDITPATISMDAIRESEADKILFDSTSLPLPIIHKDFHYTARQIAVSRNGGTPLDTATAELAARRVAEEAEKLTLGVSSSYSFGGGTIYGYTNHPNRNTQTLTAPTTPGWTPATLVAEFLSMRAKAVADGYRGPYSVYISPDWDPYLDDDYSGAKGDNTLRERLLKIEGITEILTADYLTGWNVVMVQMTSDVVRAVVGMDITTVQWETHGGMRLNFKVMAILVPQLRLDANSNSGVVHGNT